MPFFQMKIQFLAEKYKTESAQIIFGNVKHKILKNYSFWVMPITKLSWCLTVDRPKIHI